MSLNHTMEALLNRRTIRAYRLEQISEEELAEILHAAKYAPSSHGSQARHFTVVQNKQLINDMVSAALKNGAKFTPTHVPFYDAPTVIILSAPQASLCGREDCACAIMNIMVSAHEYGIGTCYICSALPGLRDEEIMKRLKLPANYLPYGCVVVGYPNENSPAPKERRSDDINFVR
nr:nitroreductase [uncultured Caproiciproducens sp.]